MSCVVVQKRKVALEVKFAKVEAGATRLLGRISHNQALTDSFDKQYFGADMTFVTLCQTKCHHTDVR